VLLWIHGGGFTLGGSFDPLYHGKNIVRNQDIIVVTFNYRLSIFGFPAGAPGLPSNQQNLGLLDVRAAIEWVSENIAAFGGNPQKITLFGESAGASITDAYLYSSAQDPIIKGAIMQSGTAFLTDQGVLGFPAGAAWQNLTQLLNCTTPSSSPTEELACARAVPAAELNTIVNDAKLPFTPIADNGTIFADRRSRLSSGDFARIPILVGSNDQEIPGAGMGEFYTASLFTCPASAVARNHAKYVPSTWQYRFFGNFPTYENFTEPGPGAFHGSEISQVFGTFPVATTELQRESAKYIQGECGACWP
jgi:carboxylesterase type B